MGIFNRTSKPEYIIAGLGNPTPKYDNTRHNAGFMAVTAFAKKYGADFNKNKHNALYTDVTVNGHRCILMLPQTFMNNSGEAVGAIARFYKIKPENIIIIFDDISLDVGRLRIRRKGSDGGHNGIKSIIMHLNSEDFPRIKIGVGKKPHPDYDLAKWVLSEFKADEKPNLETAISNAVSAVELMLDGQDAKAMNLYNG